MQKLKFSSFQFVQKWVLSLRGLGILVGLFVLFTISQIYVFNQEIEQFRLKLSKLPPSDLQQQLSLQRELLLLKKERINLQNGLAQSFGGLFFFFTVYFTWRNLKATEDKQIAERFSKAIEQLGSSQQAVRVGGIYALERIAQDSPKDHWAIIEVLSSFLRQEAVPSTDREDTIKADLQAALTVIGRRIVAQDPPHRSLNLRGAYLANANLVQGNFQAAILEGANLSHTDLRGANLSHSNLKEANLTGASLAAADLSGADLSGGKLLHLNHDNKDLSSSHVKFVQAKLINANFSNTILQQADFRGANLRNASFNNAALRATNFTSATLISVDFSGADLSRANFSQTKLQGTVFTDTDIHGANFQGAKGLTAQRIQFAKNAQYAIYDSQQSEILSQILNAPEQSSD